MGEALQYQRASIWGIFAVGWKGHSNSGTCFRPCELLLLLLKQTSAGHMVGAA
jgi:hypothetical protein